MRYHFDRAAINRLLGMFSQALQIRATLFDSADAELPSFDIADRSAYCRALRRDGQMDAACVRCDRSAIAAAKRQHSPYIYQCHRGLWEAVVPLFAPGGVYLGALLCGQLRPPDTRKRHDDATLAAAYAALPRMEATQFQRVVELLDMIGEQIIGRGLISQLHPDWLKHLGAWVDAHIAQPLTLAQLAAQVGRSAAWLSRALPQATGLSPGQWLIDRRLQRARAMLADGQSVQRVAERLGYCDPFHFSKAYKRWAGHPPSAAAGFVPR